jgi:hypothetical protein
MHPIHPPVRDRQHLVGTGRGSKSATDTSGWDTNGGGAAAAAPPPLSRLWRDPPGRMSLDMNSVLPPAAKG